MSARADFIPGSVIEIAYPFIREEYSGFDGDGPAMTWRPGVRMEWCAPDGCEAIADDTGSQILTVVDIHKPGPFPSRVFYTRRWRDPRGHEFGKSKLHIKTIQAFRLLIKGYRHEFRLKEPTIALAPTPRADAGGGR